MVELEKLTKRYYSISEVAKLFGVTNSLLRYWESEFSAIKPVKGKNGIRRYTVKDVATINIIFDLVKNQKFTIEGAKEHFKSAQKKDDHQELDLNAIHTRLVAIKRKLDKLIDD